MFSLLYSTVRRNAAVGVTAAVSASAGLWAVQHSENESELKQRAGDQPTKGDTSVTSIRGLRTSHPVHKWNNNWDGRSTGSVDGCQKLEDQGVRNIYLIRHGQYHTKVENRNDKKLTALGRRQAEATGKRLKEQVKRYDKFINSTMVRAIETADIIHNELQQKYLEREADWCLEEGAPIPAEPSSSSWRPHDSDFLQDHSRIDAAFFRYFYRPDKDAPETHEVYVCHANVIRYFICRAIQVPLNAWLRMSLANGSITHILISADGRVFVRSIGESSHLPPDMVTFN